MHRSLIQAENALMHQGETHPDGWGVSYYLDDCPHVIKSTDSAVEDSLFKQVSGLVSSETLLAHLRKSTVGENTILNTHPFQFGRWCFAHNGNIKNFSQHKPKLQNLIPASKQKHVLGTTDSELLFHIILDSILSESRNDRDLKKNNLTSGVRSALKKITDIVGAHTDDDSAPPSETFLSFILTDGQIMICYNGGKTVYQSTYKKVCPDKTGCSFYNNSCENPVDPSTANKVNHLILSSEPISGTNIWSKIEVGQLIGVDKDMNYFEATI